MDWLTEHEPREDRRNARRQRKERAGMHDSQLAQATDEEHDRQPVGDGTYDEHACEGGRAPVPELPEDCCESKVHGPPDKSLDGDDLPSVPQADARSEVIVESPARRPQQ